MPIMVQVRYVVMSSPPLFATWRESQRPTKRPLLSGPFLSGLTAASVSDVTGSAGMIGFSGLSFKQFFTGKNISEFGTFAFDYANIKGAPNGVVSADSLTFVLTSSGLSAGQFTGVAVHFCTASGGGCGPNTGFASGTPITAVPEPGALSLLATGLVGVAGLVRRRILG